MRADPKSISDNEVHTLLVAAFEALGTEATAETVRGQTALGAARRALRILQFALLKAHQDDTDRLEGVLETPILFHLSQEESAALDRCVAALKAPRPERDEFAKAALLDKLRSC